MQACGHIGWSVLGLLLVTPWLFIERVAAVEIYLRLDDGEIEGESQSINHQDEIDILTGNWDLSNTGTTQSGPGSGDGEAIFQDLTLIKYTDLSTTELIHKAASGDRIDDGVLTFATLISGVEQPILTLSMKDILVTSHVMGALGGEDRLTETFSLNFAEFGFKAYSYEDDGSLADESTATWNIVEGIEGTGNTKPTISTISGQTIEEDDSRTISFSISDSETPNGALTLLRSTSNPFVVPLSGIRFGGSGGDRTVVITPEPNATGSANIEITVEDAEGASSSQSFTVSVYGVNDAPTIAAVSNQVMNQDEVLTIPLTLADIDTNIKGVVLTASSANTSLLAHEGISFDGTGPTRQMSIAPRAGASGASKIILTASDGDLESRAVTFTVFVNEEKKNGPTDIKLTAVGRLSPLINENSVDDHQVGILSVVDPDDGNNATFTLIDTAGKRFKIGGFGQDRLLVENGVLLDFEKNSSHDIIVQATDPAGNNFLKSFTIGISNVNEPPTITTTEEAFFTFVPDSSLPIYGLVLSDPDLPAADISVTFSVSEGSLSITNSILPSGGVSNNNSSSVTVTGHPSAINAVVDSGSFTYSTVGTPIGTHQLTVFADDLGNTGPGGNQTASLTLDLEVLGSPFQQWQQDNFPDDLDDEDIKGLLADPDGDSVPNLIEYAAGTSPTDGTVGVCFAEYVEYDFEGTIYPAVKFRRIAPSLDPLLSIVGELATDDFNWGTNPTDTIIADDSSIEDGSLREVIIRSSIPLANTGRQMIRLRVSFLAPS